MKKGERALMLFLLLLGCPGLAYAYVDPGAGSLLLQLLLGGLAGAAVLGKLYWKKLVGLLRPGRSAGERSEADPTGEDSSKQA